jgi:hypothetical protein
VTVSAEGSHLRFTGALSGVTSACWSDNAEVRRVSASARPESWSASCATIAGNPRGESGRYTFSVRDPNTLSYTERTTYNWQLRDSTCTATRTASRTLTRAVPLAIPSELPPPSEPTVAEPAPEEPSTCVAGAPTALRMRAPEAPGRARRPAVLDRPSHRRRGLRADQSAHRVARGGSHRSSRVAWMVAAS